MLTSDKDELCALPVSLIDTNEGQVEGLPRNPRLIRDVRFDKLKKSIKDAPEMLEMRSAIVYPHGGRYVTVCGNMRLHACLDLGYKEIPCYILPADTPAAKLREYAIKDNVAFGETDWGALETGGWNVSELEDWGEDVSLLKKNDWGSIAEDGEEPPSPFDKDPVIRIKLRDPAQEGGVRAALSDALACFDVTVR